MLNKREKPSTKASEHLDFGEKLEAKGNWDGAMAQYRKAVRLDPNNGVAHFCLARMLEKKGDLGQAIEEYRETARLLPENVWTHEHLADMLRDKEDWDGAMAEYREALRLNPHYHNARNGLEKVLSRQEKPAALADGLRRMLADIGEIERTAITSDEKDSTRLDADGCPIPMSMDMSMRFAFSGPSDGEVNNKYPNPWAMPLEQFQDCLYGDFDDFKREWASYVPEEALTPAQLKFYRAMEAREQKEAEDGQRRYEELAERNGTTPEEEARRLHREEWEEIERKRREGLTAWEKTRGVLRDIILFPLDFALCIVSPGHFRSTFPRTRSAIQGVGNWMMMATVAFLLLLPPWFLVTGSPLVEMTVWCLAIPTICLMACYAPWYTVVSMIPFWLFYAAVSAIAHGMQNESDQWVIAWFWAWSLYPLLRGMHHIMQWEREREKNLPNHPVTKHPWLLAGTAALIAGGAHYAGKIVKKKG